MRKITIIFASVIAWACNPGDDSSKKDSEAPADDEPPLEEASKPADVAGSYLTVSCNDFEAVSAFANKSDHQTVGCLFKNRSDKSRLKASLSEQTIELILDDGSKVTPATTATGEAFGWHLGFHVSRAQASRIAKIVATVRDGEGAAMSAEAKGLDYDYAKDPAFGIEALEWVDQAGEVLFEMYRERPNEKCETSPRFPNKRTPAGRIWPLPESFLAQENLLAFTTQGRYRSGFEGKGTLGADLACQAEGTVIDPKRTWKAVLSTSFEHAKDRIKIDKPVFNTIGFIVARSADEFWNLTERRDTFGETGEDDVKVAEKSRRNRYVQFEVPAAVETTGVLHNSLFGPCGIRVREAYFGLLDQDGEPYRLAYTDLWTGTLPSGVRNDAVGTCEDWTSTARTAQGGVGRVYAGDLSLFARLADDPTKNDDSRACSLRGFLLCISQ